jgi:chromosome segregation protein
LRLKAVELENFKTFAGRVKIPIIGNFVGVTGPNGSGKSNVLDAILFILGPKSSKSMRVENLKELIFDGGKEGKPANSCSVTLTFEEEGRDIELKRHVRVKNNNYYSYYYMNGASSSMSEFDSFFASNGMEGHYNLVQQGDINKIVTSSSFEKRRIIENVAGVSGFDEDIERSERKKDEVEGNVMLLEAKLEEVKTQLKTLEADRNKALKYLELKDRLQRTRAELFTKQAAGYREKIEENGRIVQDYEKDIEKLNEELEEKKRILEERNARVYEIAAEIEEKLGGEGKKVQEQINECNVKIKTNEEVVTFYESQLKKSSERKKALENEIKALEKAREETQKAADAIGAEIEGREEELRKKREELNSIRDARKKDNTKIAELNELLDSAKKEREKNLSNRHELALAMEEIDTKISNTTREIEALENDLSRFETAAEEIKKNRREREKRLRELSETVINNKKRIADLSEKRDMTRGEIRRIKTELERLDREFSKASAHTNKAVSAVLRARNLGKLRGILGTVGEKIRPRDEKYAVAIEVAAGNRINAIITANDEDAARAIEFLKRENSGRCEFLPLNKLAPPKPMGKALLVVRDDSALGFASSLVNYDTEIKNAVDYVLGTTVVVRDLNSARRLMGGVRLVTLEGELIESSGAMIGGSLSRVETRKALETIEAEIEKRTAELEGLGAEASMIDEEISRLELEIKKSTEERKLIEQLSVNEPTDSEEKAADYRKRLNEAKGRGRRLTEQRDRNATELSTIGAKIAELEERSEDLERQITELTPKRVRESIEELEDGIKELEEFISELKKKQSKAKITLEEKDFGITQRREEMNAIETDNVKGAEAIKKSKKEMIDAENELNALLAVKAGYDEKVGSLNREKEELNKEVNELKIRTSKIKDSIDTDQDLAARCRAEIESMKGALLEAEEQLRVTGLSAQLTDRTMESLKEEIKGIEGRMLAMEPVNQMALEQYDEVTKRANEIDSSIGRLNEQKRSLTKLMNECREKKKEAFLTVFDAINENFRILYSRISNGGYGELTLENRDDPFAGGLRIVAQPPGKKAQSIERLSGGEKSVAALALVFAIQRISPSAFYFLDEVDMFLDSVNAEIIGRMIKESADSTQTIVISLRKATLKDADVVYGVAAIDGVSHMIGKININEITEEVS